MTTIARLTATELIGGLGEIAADYDAFILDLWGCLHDGVAIYPAALDCLHRLKEAGKQAVILSNAPRRAADVEQRIAGMGITRDLYARLLTSGEETWRALTTQAIPELQGRGNKAFAIIGAHDRSMLNDAALVAVAPDAADFVLAIGVETGNETVAQFEPDLRIARGRGLPLVCANPDLVVHRGGVEEICAGAIALRYEEMGGKVIWFGKPYPAVYQRILGVLGLKADRLLCVGDSLRTDVAGGKGIGAATLMTVGGIHHAEILVEDRIEPARLAELCRVRGIAPDFAIAHLRW
jgi:HAD superfamily hydrolase (TIGR01459 family)